VEIEMVNVGKGERKKVNLADALKKMSTRQEKFQPWKQSKN